MISRYDIASRVSDVRWGRVVKKQFFSLVASFGLILSALTTAHAAPSPDPDVVEARRRFEEGTKAFNLGEFDRAVKEYKGAYNAKPDPVFLYNIAQAYRLANDLPQALFFYRSFLRNLPNAPNRKDIEERIRQLETQIAQQKVITTSPPTSTVAPGTLPPAASPPPARTPEPTPTPTPTPAPTTSAGAPATASPSPTQATTAAGADLSTSAPHSDKPVYKKAWFWGVIAGVVVVAGVGAGLGVGLTRGGASAPTTDGGNQKVFALIGGGQ